MIFPLQKSIPLVFKQTPLSDRYAGICVKIDPPIPVPQEGTKENKTIISEKEEKGKQIFFVPGL